MEISMSGIEKIQSIINPMIGLEAWGISLGYGSFLEMDFGRKIVKERFPERDFGEWHLWIYMAAWILEAGTDLICASEDNKQVIRDTIHRIERPELQSVSVSSSTFVTTFRFSESIVLRVFPISYHDDREHWLLFTPDGNCLSTGPGLTWNYSPSSSSRKV